jgi:hypothetical protein
MMPASLALGRMTGLVSARPAIVKIEMCNSEHAHSSTLTLLQRHSLKENTNKAHTADYILRERLFFSMPQKQRLSSVVCVAPTSQRPAVDEGATTFPFGRSLSLANGARLVSSTIPAPSGPRFDVLRGRNNCVKREVNLDMMQMMQPELLQH